MSEVVGVVAGDRVEEAAEFVAAGMGHQWCVRFADVREDEARELLDEAIAEAGLAAGADVARAVVVRADQIAAGCR